MKLLITVYNEMGNVIDTQTNECGYEMLPSILERIEDKYSYLTITFEVIINQ